MSSANSNSINPLNDYYSAASDIRELLALSHKAVDLHLSKITALRARLEAEEAQLCECLDRERRLLVELQSYGYKQRSSLEVICKN